MYETEINRAMLVEHYHLIFPVTWQERYLLPILQSAGRAEPLRMDEYEYIHANPADCRTADSERTAIQTWTFED